MEQKKRHGCVTAWLILLIILSSISAIMYFFMGDFIQANSPFELSNSSIIITAILALVNIAFLVLLFLWKKIGFWGYLVTSLVSMGLGYAMNPVIWQSLLGIIWVIILWAVLQIKQDDVSAWKNLE